MQLRFRRPTVADAAVLLLLLTLVTPNVRLGSALDARIELFWLPVLLVALLPRLKVPRLALLLGIFWVWLALATLLSLWRGSPGSLTPVVALGLVRPALLVVVFYSLKFRPKDLIRALRGFVYLAIPLGALAVAQALNFGPAVALTLRAYASGARGALAGQLVEYGRLSRATATFEVPAYAAVYFLLVIGTALWLLTSKTPRPSRAQRALLVVGSVAALLGGIMTLSSTFIAGFAALVVLLLAVSPWPARVRLVALGVAGGALALPLLVEALRRSPVAIGSLSYQVQRLGQLNVFATRFGEDGLLVPTVAAIGQAPLIGWGFLAQPGIFLGDSAFIVWLYLGGAVGLAMMLAVLGSCAVQAWRVPQFGVIVLVWLVTLLVTGAGAPSFSIPRLGEWWWALAAITAAGTRRWVRS